MAAWTTAEGETDESALAHEYVHEMFYPGSRHADEVFATPASATR